MAEGFTQVAADGIGKRVESLPVTVPSGTIVTNADGTTTTFSSDTVLFRQAVALADPEDAGRFARVGGEQGRGALVVGNDELSLLRSIDRHLDGIHALLKMALE